ncbi:hypothetical protein FB561_6752 [Kribbella amoyensis]|uniref:Uncharacterized protein n=1 Tax=Kribbella amoyensis TaxID=996641 RepID=A0A561B8N2_9ACTN|nr:hypothetical protein [Kribbella amoyensis]TWD75314.1 hypothetical protein FB561_6752 [Kribbella amoyensis]
MQKTALLAGLVVLLAAPALPAGAASPGISGVRIAWADASHAKIRVSWTETTPVANRLWLEVEGGEPRLDLGSTAATGADEVLINTSYLGYSTQQENARIVVTDPAGGEAQSVPFDRYLRVVTWPTITFAADRSARWTLPPAPVDPNPGDPLDLAASTTYTPRLLQSVESGKCEVRKLPSIRDETGTIPDDGRSALFAVDAANEWNPRGVGYLDFRIDHSTVTVSGATATAYGSQLRLTGAVRTVTLNDTITCTAESQSVYQEKLVLQARDSSTSAWYVVGTVQTDPVGRYTVDLRNPGTREYRVARADALIFHGVRYGASAQQTVRATTRVVAAKFIQPAVAYGTKPRAYLWVDPPGSQRAALQFKNANGVWQGVSYKTLASGRGLLSFPWNRRGVTQFRWWVPGSTTSTRLPVEPVYSPTFSLTVR